MVSFACELASLWRVLDRMLTLLRAGISVFPPSDPKTGHPNNEVLGKSPIAGTYAVGQTAASRVLTNMCARAASQVLVWARLAHPFFCRQPHPDLASHHHHPPREARRFQGTERPPSQHRHQPRCGFSLLPAIPFRQPTPTSQTDAYDYRPTGLIGVSLLVFLPPAIAAFPSRASIDPKKLEKRFHDLPYKTVEFSKGL